MARVKSKTTAALLISGTLAGISAALVSQIILRFRRELQQAAIQATAFSQVVLTELGPIEYSDEGQGSPVLIVHGAGGGYDQGRVISRQIGSQYRCISVSRFGYLRSPIMMDGSPVAQADLFAALLDKLEITQVTVVGASAGGPSAIYFAERYPDRCHALVLISAVACPFESYARPVIKLARSVFKSDFRTWFTFRVSRPIIMRLHGVDPNGSDEFSATERSFLTALFESSLPAKMREAGAANDWVTLSNLKPLPLDMIQVPTLIIHAADDQLVPFSQGIFAAQHIPTANFLALRSGGHTLIGQHEKLRNHAIAFIEAYNNVE